MTQYVRLTKSLADKGILIRPEDIDKHINSEQDYYVSTYHYNDAQFKQFNQTGTIKGIKDVTTNKLWFDFDDRDNPTNAQSDAKELVTRLKSSGVQEKDIEVYFSGSKGLNVLVTLNRSLTPEQVADVTLNKFGKGLNTLDPTLYDAPQILRVPGTKHPKTGLYKIPLTVKQLNDLPFDNIKSMAKSLDNINESFEWAPVTLPDELFVLSKKEVVKKVDKSSMDLSDCPRHWKIWKWALAKGYFESGERHHALMIVAATCRSLGYTDEQAYYMCKAALKAQSSRTGTDDFPKEELWNDIIRGSVYSDSWEGGSYSPKNDPWLAKYCERMGFEIDKADDIQLTQLDDIKEEFIDYVHNIDANTILTGIPRLDKAMPLTIGMGLGLIGAASSGKTALILKILKNTSKAGVFSVFASLDMRRNRLYEKLLYQVSGLNRDELYELIREGKADWIFNKIKEDYGNVYFYDRSCPTVDDIRDYIVKIQEDTGHEIKLVALDYFERVNAERSDDTAASKEVAGKLQDLVSDLNICLITLVQPNKFALNGGPDTPILNYTSIKGSSFLYQSFRSIISIWRPFFNPATKNDDKFLQMAILKNDLGELDMFNFGWNGKRGEIWELGEEQEDILQTLLEEKNAKKENKQDDWV